MENHPADCPWHKDWHACSCGAFDVKYEITCSECGKKFMSSNHSLNVFCSVGCQMAGDPIDTPLPSARGRGRAAKTPKREREDG